MNRQVWSSKWVFILAAIGAAAGLGNLWRFPYMVYENGGGAFLLAYLLILFAFGLPLVIMEVAFGQRSQTEVIQAFGNTAGRFGRFVGWLIISVLTLVAGYYAAIIAWGVDFLLASPTLAWGRDAEGFFHERILNLSDNPEVFGNFSWPVILGLIITYALVYFSIFKGLKSVSAVIKWSVPIPFVLLVILFINSLFLPGSSEGFAFFLVPDWSKLADPNLWKSAVTQAFFSMNIGMGLTILYASFNNQRQRIIQSGMLIALGDAAVSMVAGLAMFGTLGWMAKENSVLISEVVTAGPTLAFVTFPTALALLPFGAKIFAIFFFVSILTLAIDSLFAMIETISEGLKRQFNRLQRFPHEKWIAYLCVIFFFWSLCFAGQNGLYRLDVLDHFVFGHLFYWVIFLQLFIIGWIMPVERLRLFIENVSGINLTFAFDALIKFVAPVVFIGLYILTIPQEIAYNYEGYSDDFILWWGIFPMVLLVGVSWILSAKKAY